MGSFGNQRRSGDIALLTKGSCGRCYIARRYRGCEYVDLAGVGNKKYLMLCQHTEPQERAPGAGDRSNDSADAAASGTMAGNLDRKAWATCVYVAVCLVSPTDEVITIYQHHRRRRNKMGNAIRALVGVFDPNLMLTVEFKDNELGFGSRTTMRKVGYANKHLLCLYSSLSF
jgi:hypothetical protein